MQSKKLVSQDLKEKFVACLEKCEKGPFKDMLFELFSELASCNENSVKKMLAKVRAKQGIRKCSVRFRFTICQLSLFVCGRF